VSLLRKTTRKSQQRSNPRDLDEGEYEVDDELTFGRNRQSLKFGQLVPDDELSDYVQDRLLLARMLALKKRHEVWD
jgi:predicted helicase